MPVIDEPLPNQPTFNPRTYSGYASSCSVPPEYNIPGGNLEKLTKKIVLLAAAEESYSMAATVLKPAIRQLLENLTMKTLKETDVIERLGAGMHLLEEAMGAHNRYMDSLK